MFDADGSAHPAEIPAFVAALVAGADFAKGSRFTEGGGSDDITPLRNAGNAGLNLVANTLFGTGHTDLCYGYNAFWADILPVLDLPPLDAPAAMVWGDGFEIETLLNCRVAVAGLLVAEVPSVAEEKPPKRSAMTSSVGRSPRGRVSSASRIIRRCSGMVPQQPPMIVAPASRASTAYSAISSGVPS